MTHLFNITTKRVARFGFTLVELLVVISILTVLAALSLALIRGTIQQAQENRTKSLIASITQVLNDRWESYDVRILPYRINLDDRTGQQIVRTDVLLELIRAEMPNRRAYVMSPATFPSSDFTTYYNSQSVPLNTVDDQIMARPPSVWNRYRANTTGWTDTHQEAECLYMILRSITVLDRSGIDHLHNDEIGDTDGDGFPEVLDGYGLPFQFRIQEDFDNDGIFEDLDMDAMAGFYGGGSPTDPFVNLGRIRFVVRSSRLGDEDAL